MVVCGGTGKPPEHHVSAESCADAAMKHTRVTGCQMAACESEGGGLGDNVKTNRERERYHVQGETSCAGSFRPEN